MPEYIPSRPIINLRSVWNKDKIAFPPPRVFSFARYALIYYLDYLTSARNRRDRNVLLPDYMCRDVSQTLREHGYEPCYYPLDHNFAVSVAGLDRLVRSGRDYDAIIVGHFYGKLCRNLKEIIGLCRNRGIKVIEDCVHLPFPVHSNFSDVPSDAKLYTLRKTYAVPHGATIVLRQGAEEFRQFVESIDSSKYAQGVNDALQWLCKQLVKKWLRATKVGYAQEYRDPSNDELRGFNYACPGIKSLLSMKSCEDAINIRRRNYNLYMQKLAVFERWGEVLTYDIEQDVPYMFVMYLREEFDALDTVKRLTRYGIPAVLGLALDPCVLERLPVGSAYNRIVSLPLHQDIDAAQIQYVTDVFERLGSYGGCANRPPGAVRRQADAENALVSGR